MALRKSERERLESTPVRKREYRGFTYDDLVRFGVEDSKRGRLRFEVLEDAYARLFPKLAPARYDYLWLRLMVAYELQRWLIYPLGEPERLKARRLRLRRGIVPEAFKYGESGESNGDEDEAAKQDKDEGVNMPRLKTSDIVTRAGTRRPRIFGFSVREVLLWLGANGFTFDEAATLLDRLKIEATWGTIKATVSNGRNNEGDKYGAPADLKRNQAKALKDLITPAKKKAPARKKKAPARRR